MKKNKIIKLTDKQLQEASDMGFTFLTDSDVPNYNGNSETTVSGKLTQNTYGKPTYTDQIAQKLSPQTYNRYGMTNYKGGYRRISESFEDKNNDNIDDFYQSDSLDTLSNGIDEDNLTAIPFSVDSKLNEFCKTCNNIKLSPYQNAMIINKIIECFPINNIPYKWKKELILKIQNSTKNDSHIK